MRKISRKKLEKIFSFLIRKLEYEKIDEVEITDDFYRIIPTYLWTNFEKDEGVTGSLHDDIDSLELLLKDKERFCTYVDFDRTASLLRAISEKLNPVSG